MSFNVKVKKFNKNEEEIQIFKKAVNPPRPKLKEMATPDTQKENVSLADPERSRNCSLSRTKNKVYDIARSNNWEWFVTLTFNPKKVDSFDYEKTSTKLSKWLNNIRRNCLDMKYIGVPELHESGRYHFHLLMSDIQNLTFLDKGKRDNKGRIVYNIDNYKLGWTTATKIGDSKKASNYITKYISKSLVEQTQNKKRYWSSQNLQLPEVNKYLLPLPDIEDLKEALKEKTTSAKVVKINTPDFSNEIEYLQICNNNNNINGVKNV